MEQFAIPSNVPMASSSRGRPVSAEDWEKNRETISQLYSTENKPLEEVMNVMELQYGFKATYVLPIVYGLSSGAKRL
jgi:hypothetical protein